ncbi:DUF3987 domain-containing protein, partial [Tolypothrix sp. NIES-4075]|uniref:DUF3987 domain-containing protein n=1 Tax=Tolypothrix sp. NIES-4075 TaxID=2005459 RepID=UPI000B5CB36D
MYASSNNFQIDRNQIAQQLELLGYKPGEKVFLRAFYPTDDVRKSSDKGRKGEATTVELIAQAAETFQSNGRGVYLVVNGWGQTNAEVKACRAIFYEHDNLSKELQRDLWRSLGLPEPTFQIDTGGKSIHSYWVFDQPIDPTRWKSLQADLLEFADADRSLKNPSRVMRLAGCYHLSVANGTHPTTIIAACGTRYTFKELRTIVPSQQKTPSPSLPLSTFADNVPLAVCLSKSDRELLHSGSGQGERNTNGAKLARNLIGTSYRLQYLGIQHSGSPRQLFDDYCDRCTPPLDTQEADSIWKSASKDNPTPTLSDDALLNCVKAWLLKQQIQQSPSAQNPGNANSTSSGDKKVINFPRQTLNTEALSLEIETLASGCSSRSQVRRELMRLAKFYEVPTSEVEKLYRDRCLEIDQAEDRAEIVAKLPSLVEAQNARLNLPDFLWGDGGILAESMQTVAEEMPTAPEFLFTSFLPVAASRLGTGAQIVVKPGAGFKQPAIIRTCLVAKSGDMKSPPQKAVIQPLEELENEARSAYAEEVKTYSSALRRWKKDGEEGAKPLEPVCKRYILQNGSIESRIAIHAENPRGLLLYRDEWSAHLTGRNKYRQGKGDDAENELTEFDGGQLIKDVADASKRLHLAKTAISRTGTTQFSKLKELMGEHEDGVGEFGRWLFCVAACPPSYINLEDEKPLTLTPMLKDLYRNLELMPPQEYFLSDTAKGFYQNYHNSLVDLGYSEQNPGIQIALPKLRSYFARFTLLLHCINQALSGSVTNPATHIDGFTVVAASELCSYFLAQLRVIYALNSPHEELSGRVLYLKTWFQGKENVTKRHILRTLRQYEKSSKSDLQNDLQILIDAGYITSLIKGKAIYYSSVGSFSPSVGRSVGSDSKAETPDINGLVKPLNNELSATVGGTVGGLKLDIASVSGDLTPKCRHNSDFPISETPALDMSAPLVPTANTADTSKQENNIADADTADSCPSQLTQRAF